MKTIEAKDLKEGQKIMAKDSFGIWTGNITNVEIAKSGKTVKIELKLDKPFIDPSDKNLIHKTYFFGFRVSTKVTVLSEEASQPQTLEECLTGRFVIDNKGTKHSLPQYGASSIMMKLQKKGLI